MTEETGLYCKAYYLRDLRRFENWAEQDILYRPDLDDIDAAPRPLEDADIVFLHDDYRVTDGVFGDTQLIFDGADAQWRAFCSETLGFTVPDEVREAAALSDRDLADIRMDR
jgi:hypothetical protein